MGEWADDVRRLTAIMDARQALKDACGPGLAKAVFSFAHERRSASNADSIMGGFTVPDRDGDVRWVIRMRAAAHRGLGMFLVSPAPDLVARLHVAANDDADEWVF